MKKILVIGHSYVVDTNRRFWSEMGEGDECEIELICPKTWKSNLIKFLEFKENTNTDQGIKKIHPINVYFSGNGSFYHFRWLALVKILLSKKFDGIFLFQETWSWSLFQVVLLKILSLKNLKTKLYLAVCQNIIKPKLWFLIPFEWIMCKFIEKIYFCTYEIEKVLDYKRIKAKRDYLPFTFDQRIYQAKIKHPAGGVKIGFIGRISEEKGIETLLKAVEILNQNESFDLIMAGNGPMISRLTGKNINYLGVLPHNEAHEFYHKIDILVLPSLTKRFWKEQFGRVLVEAVASGTCVVGSNSGAIPEVIGKIGLGKIFNEGDALDLASKIQELVKEMQLSDFESKMQKAIDKNLDLFSHKAVAHKLYLEL